MSRRTTTLTVDVAPRLRVAVERNLPGDVAALANALFANGSIVRHTDASLAAATRENLSAMAEDFDAVAFMARGGEA